jgi:hypothetical protein
MDIVKRNGETEPFSKDKFLTSLSKAGFSEEQINNALNEIESSLYEGITSDEIYVKALEALKDEEVTKPVIKYSLKRAVLELGPSGFPFEKLVSRIYQEKGYQTETGIMLEGKCISHELDVIAWKEDELILIEAKFHNEQHIKSDTKVALYMKARYDDLAESVFEIDGKERKMTKALLITNTGFTNNSRRYVECVGTFDMISWTYPKKEGLLKMIEDTHIHPITSVPDLSRSEKLELIKQGCIYCKDLINDPSFLQKANTSKPKRDKVLETAKMICKDSH